MKEQESLVWRMNQIRESLRPSSPMADSIDAQIVQAKLRVEGPQSLAPLVSGRVSVQAFMNALCVLEFLSTFRSECDVKEISLEELYRVVIWPLEDDILSDLYIALLRCMLLDQVTTWLTLCKSPFLE